MCFFMKYLFLVTLSLFLCISVNAQINPPSLNCIEGNGTQIEIFWDAPASTCGPIEGYTVFYAETPQSPFQTFEIDNPNATDTIIITSLTTVYCYMQTVMTCAGETVINSDTLIWDLSAPLITSISVTSGNQIQVSWEENLSPDIAAYLVYVDGNNIPDTVNGNMNTTYLDPSSNPTTAIHEYEIAWYRNCVADGDRRGSIGDPYNSILIDELNQDPCQRTFTFRWNAYENYSEGVDGYEIEVGVNGNSFNAVDTVPSNQLLYLFQNANNGSHYCFRVNALMPNNFKASSNAICDTAEVVDAPQGAQIRNASVIDNNTVRIDYYPDTAGVIADFSIQRSTLGTNFDLWSANNIGTTGVPPYDIYHDEAAPVSSNDFYYRFRRVDECDGEQFTDTVKTILMRARLTTGLDAEIEWTPYENSNGTVIRYYITKFVSGDSTIVTSVNGDMLEYEDIDAISPTSLDTICYKITAEINLNIPGIVNTTVYSHSNIKCLTPTPQIIAPTAFSPLGLNNTFKPIISFGTSNNYTFRIYDRWGRQLFSTVDPQEGWDGTDNGVVVGLEAFIYYVTFTAQDGNLYSKSGTIIAVR